MIRLHFLGANRQVTGSRYLLEANGSRVMIDCGLFQERAFQGRNWEPPPFDPRSVERVLLTHAHLDHSGLLPVLVRDGFRGEIMATPPSIDLARIVLADAARIQVEDAAYKRRRHKREGRKGAHPAVPLYTPEDVEETVERLRMVHYGRPIEAAKGIEVVYHDAGHILGSALLEVLVDDGGRKHRIVFSGDIGQWRRPLMHEPTTLDAADTVIMESTYGDRDHDEGADPESALERVVNETVERGGNLVIPTFAIDRAQELLFYLSVLTHEDRIPSLTVFLDSPMAINATTVYKRYRHLLDEETTELYEQGRHPFQFPGLHFVRGSRESRAINTVRGSCIILAGSGMCTGGRIKHHLRHNVGRRESTVLFVGYQADGTLGRQIVDGRDEVRIHGQQYPVRARIERLEGLSAHAGRSGLMKWLGHFREAPQHLFLTHGDASVMDRFGQHIAEELGWKAHAPEYGEQVDLAT